MLSHFFAEPNPNNKNKKQPGKRRVQQLHNRHWQGQVKLIDEITNAAGLVGYDDVDTITHKTCETRKQERGKTKGNNMIENGMTR